MKHPLLKPLCFAWIVPVMIFSAMRAPVNAATKAKNCSGQRRRPGIINKVGRRLTIDARDNPIIVEGVIDEKTTLLVRDVRLMLSGTDGELSMLPADLTPVDPSGIPIGRHRVIIPAGVILKRDQPRDISVTITDLKKPGIYTGTLEFVVLSNTARLSLTVPIELRAQARPDVKPQASSFQLVRCVIIPCRVTDWLLPKALSGEKRTALVRNNTLAKVDLQDRELTLRGEKTGGVFTMADVRVEVPDKFQPGADVPITLVFNRALLPADRYQSTLRLKLKGADAPEIVSFTIDVRNGPWWALVALLLGILVGRLAQQMASPEGLAEKKFMDRYYSLLNDVNKLSNPVVKKRLIKLLEASRQRLRKRNETEETLNSSLDEIETEYEFFADLEHISKELTEMGPAALEQRVKPHIDQARSARLAGNVELANEEREEINKLLIAAQSDSNMGSEESKRFDELLAGSTAAVRVAAVPPTPSRRSRWRVSFGTLLAKISGARMISPEVRYWLLRPLFFIVLLVLLLLVGLQTLYINAGTTFGSSGLYDYLGLFLWGLSADVAQRSLQNLSHRDEKN